MVGSTTGFGWRGSLDACFAEAPAFYLTLLMSLAAGAGITLLGVGPIRLLFFSCLAGGLATPVTLALMMSVVRDREAMSDHVAGRYLIVAGRLVTAVVTGAGVAYLGQTFVPGAGGGNEQAVGRREARRRIKTRSCARPRGTGASDRRHAPIAVHVAL